MARVSIQCATVYAVLGDQMSVLGIVEGACEIGWTEEGPRLTDVEIYVPQLFLGAELREAGLPDQLMEQRGDVAKLDVGGLAKLAEVGKGAIHLLRVREPLARGDVRACQRGEGEGKAVSVIAYISFVAAITIARR